jgi:hypothetical protein
VFVPHNSETGYADTLSIIPVCQWCFVYSIFMPILHLCRLSKGFAFVKFTCKQDAENVFLMNHAFSYRDSIAFWIFFLFPSSGHSEVQWAKVWQKTHSCWLGCSKKDL